MKVSACLILLALPTPVLVAVGGDGWIDLTGHAIGLFAIAIFALAYVAVMTEEVTQLRKSKPVLLAAGIIWVVIAWVYAQHGLPGVVATAARHNVLEYSELLLFLLVAMAYINSMDER